MTLIDINQAGLAETAKVIQGAGGASLELEADVTQSEQVASRSLKRSRDLDRSTFWSIQPE